MENQDTGTDPQEYYEHFDIYKHNEAYRKHMAEQAIISPPGGELDQLLGYARELVNLQNQRYRNYLWISKVLGMPKFDNPEVDISEECLEADSCRSVGLMIRCEYNIVDSAINKTMSVYVGFGENCSDRIHEAVKILDLETAKLILPGDKILSYAAMSMMERADKYHFVI